MWNPDYLQSIEKDLISAFRHNLISGFVEGKDITIRADGTNQCSTPYQGGKIWVTDSWTSGSPSIGQTLITLADPADNVQKVVWGMNYSDRFYPEHFADLVTKKQILTFLRRAIQAFDLENWNPPIEPGYKPENFPLRGQHSYSEAIPDSNLRLLYSITDVNYPYSTFGSFRVQEDISIWDKHHKKAYWVFSFKGTGTYLDLK